MNDSGFLNEDFDFESIEKLDSQGGTSETFIVRLNGKNYFMKKLRAEYVDDRRYCSCFEKEYEVGKLLNSPYIPEYISFNKTEDEVYILMEYILGENIESRLESNPHYFHNEKNVHKLLMQLLDGLEDIHKKDILHLDINPKNIMLTQFGDNVKITDLGFCANATQFHTAGSTIGFQAPEVQEKEIGEIDRQSDIFAVGLLLRYIKEHSGAKYSRHLNSFMYRCLNNKKSNRFQSTEEAKQFLQKHQHRHLVTTITTMVCIVVATVAAMLVLMTGTDENITQATLSGVNYRVLSQEKLTCEVTGGEGWENNIYIEPKVVIGDNIYRTIAIKDSAFSTCDILSVHIPEGIEIIGKGAFHDCDSIITLNLPSTIKEFNGAFVRMSNTKKISLSPVKKVCTAAFVDNSSLESIIIPEGTEYICRDAFVSCISLKNLSLPQSLRVLERGVFYNCQALEKITIPAQVTEIGDYAFFECKNLRCIYCYAMTPPRITAIINTANVTVFVPETALDNYKKDFNWAEYNIQPMKLE
jgi:tRNA A-37 threonylcarbamoyl transferase component Bud32